MFSARFWGRNARQARRSALRIPNSYTMWILNVSPGCLGSHRAHTKRLSGFLLVASRKIELLLFLASTSFFPGAAYPTANLSFRTMTSWHQTLLLRAACLPVSVIVRLRGRRHFSEKSWKLRIQRNVPHGDPGCCRRCQTHFPLLVPRGRSHQCIFCVSFQTKEGSHYLSNVKAQHSKPRSLLGIPRSEHTGSAL